MPIRHTSLRDRSRMKFSTTPYQLNLRRARFLQIVLFGAFVFSYVGVLQSERILHLIYRSGFFPEDVLSLIAPWHFALPAAFFGMLFFWLYSRKHHISKKVSGLEREIGFILLTFIFCILTSPRESTNLELKMQRLNRFGHYNHALKASMNYVHPTPGIIEQRNIALENLGKLEEDFFIYPLGDEPLTIDSCHKSLTYLLTCNLDSIAAYLKGIPKDSLRRPEKEALILYKHISPKPIIRYSNSSIEANYADYCSFLKEIRAKYPLENDKPTEAEKNMMGDIYGTTYWHYYYYGIH